MLIINADDWGKNKLTTDNTLSCFKNHRITSASAMVFMADSERSTELALENGLDVGLHLNFTLEFDGNIKSNKLIEFQRQIALFLLRNKYCLLLYNPFLQKQIEYVYKSQYDEYIRLYKNIPTHIDGHKHMHLCTNILVNRIIPYGCKVRKNFSFAYGEKTFFNRGYRFILDKWLKKKYVCTDLFFDIVPFHKERLQKIVTYAKSMNVELMVHPERAEEFTFLMCDTYQNIILDVQKGNFYRDFTTTK